MIKDKEYRVTVNRFVAYLLHKEDITWGIHNAEDNLILTADMNERKVEIRISTKDQTTNGLVEVRINKEPLDLHVGNTELIRRFAVKKELEVSKSTHSRLIREAMGKDWVEDAVEELTSNVIESGSEEPVIESSLIIF